MPGIASGATIKSPGELEISIRALLLVDQLVSPGNHMETITLTESEVGFIMHILVRYYFVDPKIVDVMHLLTMKFPLLREEFPHE